MGVVITAVLGMSFNQRERYNLKNSARELIRDFYEVKGVAIKENRTVRMDFSTTPFSYSFLDTGEKISDYELCTDTGVTIANPPDFAINSRGIVVNPSTGQIINTQSIDLRLDTGEWIKVNVFPYGGIKTSNSWRGE